MLIPFTSASFTNLSGLAVADGADVEVRLELNGALAALFDDRDGTTPLTNPFNADSQGRFAFYVAGRIDGYSIQVSKGAQTHTLRHQLTGSAAATLFDNTGTGLLAESVQDAIEEIGTFTQSGTTPVTRTTQAKSRERPSAKDSIGETYGADDTTALQNRITDEATVTGREILVNAGTLITTGVALSGAAGDQVSLKGDPQTIIKAKVGATNAVLISIADDITRTGFREIKSLKVDGADVSGVTGIKAGNTTGAALQVYLRSIDIRDCAVALDLYSSMENSVTDVVAYSNTVGVKLRQDATNGGGNANRFDGLRLQSNTVGLVLNKTSAFPMENNQFNQTLIQSNTLCGIAMFGLDYGFQFNAAHFEANASAGTTLDVDGKTITKSAVFMDGSFAIFNESTFGESAANPCIILQNGSRIVLRNSGGYGLESGVFIDGTFANVVEFQGHCVLLGQIRVQVDRWPDSYLETASQWTAIGTPALKFTDQIPNDFAKNPLTPLLENPETATINADAGDALVGIASNATFAASSGSTGTNRIVIDAVPTGVTAGDTWVVSLLVKASGAGSITFIITDGSHAKHTATLDTTWRRLVMAFRATSTNAPAMFVYPEDTAGVTVYFARLQSLRIASGGDMSLAHAMVREGLFNPNQAEFSYSAVPTVGTWKRGDRIWNNAPSAGGTPGWVCTTAGTPGTWKAMAALAS